KLFRKKPVVQKSKKQPPKHSKKTVSSVKPAPKPTRKDLRHPTTPVRIAPRNAFQKPLTVEKTVVRIAPRNVAKTVKEQPPNAVPKLIPEPPNRAKVEAFEKLINEGNAALQRRTYFVAESSF